MADQVDFVIDQGSDWVVQVSLQNDDRTPLNLRGYRAHLQCRATSGGTPVIDLSTAAGTITINGPLGQLNWGVPGAQTAAYTSQTASTPGSTVLLGVYDLFLEMPGGQLSKYLYGQISLTLSETLPF